MLNVLPMSNDLAPLFHDNLLLSNSVFSIKEPNSKNHFHFRDVGLLPVRKTKFISVPVPAKGSGAILSIYDSSSKDLRLKHDFQEFFVTQNIQMCEELSKLKRYVNTPYSIFLSGETGTGKSKLAKAIHDLSNRKHGQFVQINCAAISENLLESELFGHEIGAFSGALKTKRGLFEVADKGTFFLDEITELPIWLQAKLLKVVESKKFRRVGGINEIDVDVRIISASNKDLRALITKGLFRQDLFYRLFLHEVFLPALRERKDDIPHLANHFLKKLAKRQPYVLKRFTNKAMLLLQKQDWIGNVRELENVVINSYIIAYTDSIKTIDVEEALYKSLKAHNTKETKITKRKYANRFTQLIKILKTIERGEEGRFRLACERAGVCVSTGYRWLKNAGLNQKEVY